MALGGAPRTAPNGPPPSQVQTAPNLVQFDPKLVVPSQPLYLQRNDVIAFNLLTNGTNITVRVNYRWLTPAGEIEEGELNTPPTTGAGFFTLGIYEGWLLSFAARVTSGAVLGQWAFIQALITRANNPNAQSPMHSLFWSGFIYSFTANGWPGLPAKEITDGAGTIRVIPGTFPGAGSEIQETVPAQRRWALLSFRTTLTTNATVANRIAGITLDDGANIFYAIHNQGAQAAGAVVTYNFALGVQPYIDGANNNQLPLPVTAPIKTGYHIRTNSVNLQAGDQYSQAFYEVLEWGQWDS